MKAVEFIKKYELSSALAAGFLDHLRRDPEEDVKEEILKNAFQEFSGINPDKNKNGKQSEINENADEKSNVKTNDSISITQTMK
ncbi:hypothetical protein A0128_00930 [Leptospira tipperaryensis]|uniref:Uncharacterized protein n=1 Tax=Leptospira tipperaryensis TaxID=2564040 RepID=A0A1D7USN5_9LEPT|nr:hypothetical protein [Leptospira tipperaryensis]AOP32563.1 hypothetical protein A0128_00930 [Leptospira tipperaryensis]